MKLAWRRWLELLGSMRLAITMLLIIALASIIGTLIPQGEPYSNYQFQFGLFWFKQFAFWGLYDIYHTTWFISLLGILLLSTSICVYRYTPSMLKAMRHWRPVTVTERLKLMPHVTYWECGHEQALKTIKAFQHQLGRFAQAKVFSAKQEKESIILRWGAQHRWGYILTHVGIILICIGGVLDSNLLFKWQQWTGTIAPETRDLLPDAIPSRSRLSIDNPSFRAQVNIPEGSSSNYAFQNLEDGYLLQPLPFQLKLDRFHVEYHSTGQPKAFISDITVKLPNGKQYHQAVEVNKPFLLGPIAIYQSSFGDGGTELSLQLHPLFIKENLKFPAKVKVFEKYKLANHHTIEVTDFKPINVEGNPNSEEQAESVWQQFLSAVPKQKSAKTINLGASWIYKDRDAQGQAYEYQNYLEPVHLEGYWYMISGIRAAMDQPFRYLRFPLTPQGYIEPYFLWRLYFLDSTHWKQWAQSFARQQGSHKDFSDQVIVQMTQSVLALFAKGGYEQVAVTIQKQVPKKEQEHIAQLYLKIMNQLSYESYKNFYNENGAWQNKMPAPDTKEGAEFIHQALLSISDSYLYKSPYYLQVQRIVPVQASGFQITRSPGKSVVYLGCIVLVIGIFLLFYWREVRVWCWYEKTHLYLAFNSNRLDSLSEQRFNEYCHWIEQRLKEKGGL